MVRLASGSADLLDSWKAIAEYVNRNVRTVQRWEQTKSLPIHRLPGGQKPGVFALKSELETWRGAKDPAKPPSVAVLPFTSLSGEPEAQCFSDGLADSIITGLAQVRGLRVAARTSSFAFRGQALDVREIGSTLDVGAVLEGTVQWSGSWIRVSAQLIDSSNGYHLWSDLYDRPVTDIFEVQDDIASSIVRGLKQYFQKPFLRSRFFSTSARVSQAGLNSF